MSGNDDEPELLVQLKRPHIAMNLARIGQADTVALRDVQ
jgi:hypothetical protein